MEPKNGGGWKMILRFRLGDFKIPDVHFPGCRYMFMDISWGVGKQSSLLE